MFGRNMTNGNGKLVFKEEKMAIPASEDMGFCSGEEYFESEIHSPTDNSEDSVEVKISPISIKNKRKLVEPRKVDALTGPLKKRVCLKVKAESNESSAPFRPWSPPANKPSDNKFVVPFPVKPEPEPSPSYFRPPSPARFCQDQPVALVKREEKDSDVRVPVHPQVATLSTAETERMILKTNEQFPMLQTSSGGHFSLSPKKIEMRKLEPRREQRNYKNMTRERRIEANARERTRVHTISAAFDTLRRAIPSYSHNQKLSKLSVLRIACSYIMTLSNIVNDDEEGTAQCVDMVSRTIQREGKLRKKKDEED